MTRVASACALTPTPVCCVLTCCVLTPPCVLSPPLVLQSGKCVVELLLLLVVCLLVVKLSPSCVLLVAPVVVGCVLLVVCCWLCACWNCMQTRWLCRKPVAKCVVASSTSVSVVVTATATGCATTWLLWLLWTVACCCRLSMVVKSAPSCCF